MKNLKLLLLCIPFLTINCDDSYNVHNITFESLAHDLWTDHVLVFEEIFKLMPISTILEIGSSKASKYLAENCINLVTYEIALKDLFNSIMPPFIEINSKIKPHFPFWHIEMQTLKDNVNDANNLAQQGKNPLSNESSYIEEIKHLFDKACEYKTFDIIFIDGLHHSDQVYKDILNSVFFLNINGTIIVHDCNPINYFTQLIPRPRMPRSWNGDVWRGFLKLKSEKEDLEMFVIDIDHGCGIVRRGKQNLITKWDMEYQEFEKNKKELLNLISVDDFINYLNEK